MNTLKLFSTVFLFVLLLSGCGFFEDQDIGKVKEAKPFYFNALTYSDLLDNRDICASVKWSTYKNSAKKKVVQYRCNINDVPASYLSFVNQIEQYHQSNSTGDSELRKLEENLRQRENNASDLAYEVELLEQEGKLGTMEYSRAKSRLNRAVFEVRAAVVMVEQHKEARQERRDYYAYEDIDKYIHHIKNNLDQTDAYEIFEWVVEEGFFVEEKVSLIKGALYHKNPIDEDYKNLSSEFKFSPYRVPSAVLNIINRRQSDDYLEYKKRLASGKHINPGTNYLYLMNFIE